MKYCSHCGAEIDDKAVICPNCGVQQKNLTSPDNGGFGWGLLGFCIPIVGLILYLVWINDKPNNAKAVGIGALISIVIGILGYMLT